MSTSSQSTDSDNLPDNLDQLDEAALEAAFTREVAHKFCPPTCGWLDGVDRMIGYFTDGATFVLGKTCDDDPARRYMFSITCAAWPFYADAYGPFPASAVAKALIRSRRLLKASQIVTVGG